MPEQLITATQRLPVFNERTQQEDSWRLLQNLAQLPLDPAHHHKAGITGTCSLGPPPKGSMTLGFAPSHAWDAEQAFHRTYQLARRLEAQGYVKVDVRGLLVFEVMLTEAGVARARGEGQS
jgi:hypothetical protein